MINVILQAKHKFILLIASLLLLTPTLFGTLQNVHAAVMTDTNTSVTTMDENSAEVQRLADEAEFLFTKATHYENGVFTYDKDLCEATYGKELAPYVVEGARSIYQDKNLLTELQSEQAQYKSFTSCMISEAPGWIPGYDLYQLAKTGNFVKYISDKLWTKLAKLILSFVGGGSLPGIVASITLSAGKCAIWG